MFKDLKLSRIVFGSIAACVSGREWAEFLFLFLAAFLEDFPLAQLQGHKHRIPEQAGLALRRRVFVDFLPLFNKQLVWRETQCFPKSIPLDPPEQIDWIGSRLFDRFKSKSDITIIGPFKRVAIDLGLFHTPPDVYLSRSRADFGTIFHKV